YPFEFHKADALLVLEHDGVRSRTAGTSLLDDVAAFHASPPCQSYSAMSNRWGSDQPELIDAVRALVPDGIPYVIENVEGARWSMREPIVRLTGEMFGLPVYRPRLFELGGWWMIAPAA